GQTLHRGEAAVLAVVSAEHAQVALALLAEYNGSARAQALTPEMRARLGI
ncbi:MAG: hypothetical protein H7Z42_09565, partial [Roseiflexaceae bacterium]|nr:hypothetical protein [Roseiflexaceae bacterium]